MRPAQLILMNAMTRFVCACCPSDEYQCRGRSEIRPQWTALQPDRARCAPFHGSAFRLKASGRGGSHGCVVSWARSELSCL